MSDDALRKEKLRSHLRIRHGDTTEERRDDEQERVDVGGDQERRRKGCDRLCSSELSPRLNEMKGLPDRA